MTNDNKAYVKKSSRKNLLQQLSLNEKFVGKNPGLRFNRLENGFDYIKRSECYSKK